MVVENRRDGGDRGRDDAINLRLRGMERFTELVFSLVMLHVAERDGELVRGAPLAVLATPDRHGDRVLAQFQQLQEPLAREAREHAAALVAAIQIVPKRRAGSCSSSASFSSSASAAMCSSRSCESARRSASIDPQMARKRVTDK